MNIRNKINQSVQYMKSHKVEIALKIVSVVAICGAGKLYFNQKQLVDIMKHPA